MTSVMIFLSVVVAKGWELHQIDVNNAFLRSNLDEEVFMRLRPGFSSKFPNKVCQLKHSLYGLRQAPRQWFIKLSSKLSKYGFVRSYADYSLFTYQKGVIFWLFWSMLMILCLPVMILKHANNSMPT